MIVRRNPPSFILVDKATGEVVYTKRATGVGSEAIAKCAERGRALAARTGRTYFVYLDIMGVRVGARISVPTAYALGITEEISPGRSTQPNPRGAVRRNIYTFNNPYGSIEGADKDAARELELYIENDSQLYHSQFIPIVKNLMLKRRKGVFNSLLAAKLFLYLVEAGAKKYCREFGGVWHKMFSMPTRQLVANHFVFSFGNEADLGNYDRLIGPASNPRGVRKNIYTFNNPRKLNTMEQAAAAVGLYVTTWAPGDGVTRYRFHKGPADYNDGSGIYTALGRGDAMNFIRAYGMGKGRKNPPVCSNPVIRGDKLPRHLQEEILRRFIYRWTTGNTRREEVYRRIEKPRIPLITDAQWLREHAFHVTKTGKLDARHAHAEPYYMADDWKKGDPRPNPLLQTVFAANPPISAQWDTMTRRQRLAVMEVAGYEGGYAVNRSWAQLDPSMRRNIEQLWLDTSSRGGTTRRRHAVAVNPLTKRESTQILRRANNNLRMAQTFRPGHTRSEKSGQAFARGMVVKQYGPPKAKRVAGKVITRAQNVAGTTLSNPGTLRLPKPGTRLTVSQALDLARRIGDRGLIEQCQKALKLQKAANRNAKCVIWKTFAMGSKDKIDSVVALTHYGDSPETMYKPPKGSKKGQHMYRHKWGEGGGGRKTVPLLASADGKMLLMPLEGRKVAADWLRH